MGPVGKVRGKVSRVDECEVGGGLFSLHDLKKRKSIQEVLRWIAL